MNQVKQRMMMKMMMKILGDSFRCRKDAAGLMLLLRIKTPSWSVKEKKKA